MAHEVDHPVSHSLFLHRSGHRCLRSGSCADAIFHTSAEQSFDEQLDITLKILVGDLASKLNSDTPLTPPRNLGEPRYELPLSGYYWTIAEKATGEILLASESLVGGGFEMTETTLAGELRIIRAYGLGPEGEKLRILTRTITFSETQSYIIRVTGNAERLDQQVSDFQQKAWLIMAGFGAIMLALSYILIRSGLRPLYRLREQVRHVTQGQSDRIAGDYPLEVSGLVNEANTLIASNRQTLERARTQVGNLAHSLKTPLSVITNAARELEGAERALFGQQASVMRDQIQLYLERARMAARRNVIGTVTHIQPVVAKLTSVMRKIHKDCSIEILEKPSKGSLPALCFRGEEHDLEEMLGNLVDNGCKWARNTVQITIMTGLHDGHGESVGAEPHAPGEWFTIIVEDDGQGMSEEEISFALQRGKRLDESKPGTGLGLSIVEEMADLYQGRLTLDRSDLGGVRATLTLPAMVR